MYFFSTLKIIALAILVGDLSLYAGSFTIALSSTGEIPHSLPLPYYDGDDLNLLTGRPLHNGRKLIAVLDEAKKSSAKSCCLRIFCNRYEPASLIVSNGTEEQNLTDFYLAATYGLQFSDTEITITSHFEPVVSPSSTHHTTTPYYSAHLHPHPTQWGPHYYIHPLSAPQQPHRQPFYCPPLAPSYQHPQFFLQRNFQDSKMEDLQGRLRQLHMSLLEVEGQSQEQRSVLQQHLLEKQALLKKIADLEEALQQRTPPASLSSACASLLIDTTLESVAAAQAQQLQPVSLAPSPAVDLASPTINSSVPPLPAPPSFEAATATKITIIDHRTLKKESAPTSIEVNDRPIDSTEPVATLPAKIALSKATSTASTSSCTRAKSRNRARKKIEIPVVHVKEEKEDDYAQSEEPSPAILTLAAKQEEEMAKQKRIQEEAERNRLRRAAQDAEKATQAALWQKVENACARRQFSEAFAAIEMLNQKNSLYIKGLFTIIKALSKGTPKELYPNIIEAAQALFKANVMQKKEDRKILIEFLLKHSSEANQEELLKEAADLGNVLAATHWHLLQMKKATEPCGKKSCVHRKALQFFSSQSDNPALRTHVPRYFAIIQATTQCPHQKDSIAIIRTLMAQAQSSGLSEVDRQNVELRIPEQYKEIPVVTPTAPVSKKATPPTTQERFEFCKAKALNALERDDLQAAKDATVVFVREQKETSTLEKIIACLTEGLPELDTQSTIALQLTTLMYIETIIDTFRNALPLDHLENLRKIFEKIPMRETHLNKTRQEKCLAQLQLQLSHILNRYFIQLAYLQADFHQAKTLSKKQRVLDEKLTSILNEAQTPADACRIMQSLINYRTSDENGFSRQVETFVGTFIDQHPEKKAIWQRYVVNSKKNFPDQLKSLYEEFEERKGIYPKAQIVHLKVRKVFEEVTTREEAENFIQALNYYFDDNAFSFFGLTVTFIRGMEHTKELWQGLLPAEKKQSWCTLL